MQMKKNGHCASFFQYPRLVNNDATSGQTHWATCHTENTASKIFFMYSTSTAQANCMFFTDSFSFVSFLYRL
ncbi:MAG: hypothetical protein IJA63_02305, partial [Akkermansia sp.]|nr:hypothetical protein [Akkermansia sp.]